MPTNFDIALLTESRFSAAVAGPDDWYLRNILRDDALLTEALARRGVTATRVDWASPDVDWSRFRCAMFRTTWNYFKRFDEFMEWFARAERVMRFCNAPSIVRWNIDKHYLADLEAAGVAIVPSRYMEKGSGETLGEAMRAAGWSEAIVKPCVSGGAYNTYRVRSAAEAAALEGKVAELLAKESLILQPFMDDIVRVGEDTLMVLNGHYTHAIRKKVKAGDFRVQDDFGGTVHDYKPTPEQIELAERAMAACARDADPAAGIAARPAPVYGRVDMVRDNDGRLAIMELELIEPELWLRNHPPAADVLAEGLAKYLVKQT